MTLDEQAELIGFTIAQIEEDRGRFAALPDGEKDAAVEHQKEGFFAIGRELFDVVTDGTPKACARIWVGYAEEKARSAARKAGGA